MYVFIDYCVVLHIDSHFNTILQYSKTQNQVFSRKKNNFLCILFKLIQAFCLTMFCF